MSQATATIAPSRGEPQDPVVGHTVLGRYRVVKPLAKGGMGVVYLGRTEGAAGFARPVVIKRVLPSLLADPDIAKMFVREAKILSNLHHPGIVGVLDFGKEDDKAYVMVLDYVHGYDAAAWLKHVRRSGRQVPVDVALQITIRLLEALQYAHTLKRSDGTATPVIHRDVSPGNILLDPEGHVRVLDFGIARIARQATDETDDSENSQEFVTQETTFKGKLSYAHPSLLAREEPCPQTDIYSAAVVLFQMLTGENPFRGATPAQTLNKVANLPLPELRDYLPSASEELEAILLKAMSRDLEDGYRSAAEFADALREVRTLSENDVLAEMSLLLTNDFTGDMPRALDLEPLEVRDAAWRTSVVDLELGQLRSTPPPPVDPHEMPTVVGGDLSEKTVKGDPLSALAGEQTVISTSPKSKARSSSMRGMVLATSAVAVALVAVAAALFYQGGDASKQEQRYLVVSKEQDTGQQPATEAKQDSPQQPPASSEQETTSKPDEAERKQPQATSKPSKKSGTGAATGPVKPEPRLLTQRFSKHQGGVQACFRSNPDQAKSTPNVQISFNVSSSGKVNRAGLIPSSVASTPLGSCLLRVARGASFGALTESVSFRIPVSARIK